MDEMSQDVNQEVSNFGHCCDRMGTSIMFYILAGFGNIVPSLVCHEQPLNGCNLVHCRRKA